MKHLEGKRAVLYRRVSTTEQKDKGSSLETQQERLQDFCSRNDMEIIKDFSEDYSAKNINRPVFNQLLQYLTKNKNNIDYLLLYSFPLIEIQYSSPVMHSLKIYPICELAISQYYFCSL